jgi:PadR family transcriptional regulator PadR
MYKREMLKGNTETLLLSLLTEGAKYGYMLVKEIEARSNGYFRVKDGTVYPALHRMEKEALVASVWDSSTNGQSRRVYEITPKGHQMLKSLKEEWERFCRALGLIMGGSDQPHGD